MRSALLESGSVFISASPPRRVRIILSASQEEMRLGDLCGLPGARSQARTQAPGLLV